jgi:hypothetical protein
MAEHDEQDGDRAQTLDVPPVRNRCVRGGRHPAMLRPGPGDAGHRAQDGTGAGCPERR